MVPGLHYLRAEAVYAVRQEMAGTVADVLDRAGPEETVLLMVLADGVTVLALRTTEALARHLDRARLDHGAGGFDGDRRGRDVPGGAELRQVPAAQGPA